MTKPDFCKSCPISYYTTGYVPLQRGTSRTLVVGEAADDESARQGRPFVGGAGSWLNSMLRAAHIGRNTLNIINTIGCHPVQGQYPGDEKWTCTDRETARRGIEYCAEHHLRPAIEAVAPTKVIALGDEALFQTTGRRNILLWRGSPLPLRGRAEDGPRVVPTLHPSFLMKSASMFSVAVKDLGRSLNVPPEHYDLYPTLDTVRAFQAPVFSFDFEWDEWGQITMCGLSDRWYHAIVVPFCGDYIPELKRIFEAAEVLIGHNIVDADTWYFEQLGWNVRAKLHDTMLAQHLIQPDMRHGLHFVASVFTSKVFWKGQGEEEEDVDGNVIPTGAQWKTWNSLDAIPRQYGGYGGCASADEAWRLYNARDTDGSLQAETPIFRLLNEWKQDRVYWNVSVPAAYVCRDMNRAGLKIDHARLGNIRETLNKEIAEVEQTLPDGLRPYEEPITKQVPAPPGTYKPRTLVCRGTKKARTVHDEVSWTVHTPGPSHCPTCAKEFTPKLSELKRIQVPATKRIVPWNSQQRVLEYASAIGCKPVPHLKTGNDSADKRARKIWGRNRPEFTIVDALKKLATRRNGFAKESLTKVDRVLFRLAVTGTSEGRLACSGQRKGIDPNIQNQPKEIRKIFIPDRPGFGILNLDIVQGENMLTAWLAKDWVRWERLNTEGYDEHSDMASKFFNQLVTKKSALRKPGKIINHGRNYGLGVEKTREYLALEGFYYTQADVREMIEIWKRENARTAQWQQETIEIARKQGYLENPFGRRRWFQGRDYATKALAFLPASTLADMVLRMMIAHYPERFQSELSELGLGVTGSILDDWRMCIQVHDSLVLQGPDETHMDQARRTKAIMEQTWPELDGFRFRASVEYSTESWGDCDEIEITDALLPVAA